MRFRLTATVEGEVIAPRLFETVAPDCTIGFSTDNADRVTALWVETTVADFGSYAPTMKAGKGTEDDPHVFGMPTSPEAERLTEVLQYLEGLGSFWLGIRRVGWGEAKMEWLPDSEEEARQLRVFSLTRPLKYTQTPMAFDPEIVARLLLKREQFAYLVIPMSFYREGVVDYTSHRYVYAFFSFYFFLEDLYGQGKTKNVQIQQAFLASSQLRGAIGRVLSRLDDPDLARHKMRIAELCARLRCEYSVTGMVEFLVLVRGALHHFSQRSTRPKGHPLNQSEWRSVAFFIMTICLDLIALLANGTPLDPPIGG